jgi:hypothetical protein
VGFGNQRQRTQPKIKNFDQKTENSYLGEFLKKFGWKARAESVEGGWVVKIFELAIGEASHFVEQRYYLDAESYNPSITEVSLSLSTANESEGHEDLLYHLEYCACSVSR